MLSKVLRIGMAATFLCTIVLLAGAQQPPAGTQPPPTTVKPGQPVPAATDVTFRAKEILGTKISIQGGTAIGTVDDLVFDTAGNMEYLVVSRDDGKLISVPWDAAKFDVKSRTATLPITADVYKTVPTYTTTTYPEFFTPAYRTQVYKLYNLTPRELRRLERR